MFRVRQAAIAVVFAMTAAAQASGATGEASSADMLPGVVSRPSDISVRAPASVVLSLARAGKRLVAVGERGHILVSDDGGRNWRQSPVESSVTLTAVRFASPMVGWAAGHYGVVLATRDGGNTWVRQMDGKQAAALLLSRAESSGDAGRIKIARRWVSDGPDKPVLTIAALDEQMAMAFGAFGLALMTTDGGRTWTPIDDRLSNPRQLHINASTVSGRRVVLVGEQGLFLISEDGGESFQPRRLPYDGSLFHVSQSSEGSLLVAGLRGHAFRSQDGGQTWAACDHPVDETIMDGAILADGRPVLATVGGRLLVGDTACTVMGVADFPGAGPISAITEDEGGALVLGGLAGVSRQFLKSRAEAAR